MNKSTTALIAALKGMRTSALGASFLDGGWIEDGDAIPVWPFAVFELDVSDPDELGVFTFTETIWDVEEKAAATRVLADTMVETLDKRSYKSGAPQIKGHFLEPGSPSRVRRTGAVGFELTWRVLAVWGT